ncbi:MAG TPA: phosphoribosylglycinamide formyltransferase [Candidatus Dormibacteraeota bacterium]|jgi:phosphoribosylglycinamide formyltransferase-1
MRLGVAVSGKGSNLRNLVERGFQVVAVVTNRPSCGAAELARARGIPLGEFAQSRYPSAAERDAAMRDFLVAQGVQLVVCAGYDRIFTQPLFAGFRGRIINIHPSLLPAFAGGMDAVEQALAAGVRVSGCTVHHVIEEVDAGPVILQSEVPVLPGDTPETLRARIQAEEHRLLPRAIELVGNAARAAVGQ